LINYFVFSCITFINCGILLEYWTYATHGVVQRMCGNSIFFISFSVGKNIIKKEWEKIFKCK